MSVKILEKNQTDKLVLDFIPKAFPVIASQSTTDFISSQDTESSDFQINELLSEQVGIIELKKKKLETKIENQILEELKDIEEKAYREAFNLGMIEGEKKAYSEKSEEIKQRLIILEEFLENTKVLYKKLFEKNENTLIRLMFGFASKIALFEIDKQPEKIVTIVKETMDLIQGDIKSNIIISDKDKEFLDEIKENVTKDFEFLNKVEFSTSEEIQPGGCIIETNFGVIDASIEERIDKVWTGVDEKLPESSEDIITDE
ncbi:MAG: hypothetical protein HOO06_16550 [Bdellovibrionaceae bacterium]|nr:hypothetical protein [Pseudobdellovibrionaceae bacterium]